MKNLFLIIMFFSTQFAFAQSELPKDFGNYQSIPNSVPGKVYTQAYVPPTFKKVVWRDSVLLLENNRHLIGNLEKGKDYEIVTEIVETYPAYTIWEFEELKVDTVWETKTVIIDRICEEIKPMPKYENQLIIGREKMFERQFRFVHLPMTKDNISKYLHYEVEKHKNAYFLTYAKVEVPARYKSYYKKVFQKDGKWWTETIADTLTDTRNVITTLLHNIYKKEISSKKDTLQLLIFFNTKTLNTPNYSTIEQQIIDQQGKFTEWKDLPYIRSCPTTLAVSKIQKALKARGYDVPINNILDKATKAALIQFQKDNVLIIGSLGKETLELLGVDF
jgi:hypothetical protein